MDIQEILSDILPALMTAFVSTIAMITSYKATRNAATQSYNNNVDSMRFTQKEKVADQIAEKAAILLTKCDPNVLNTVINEIVPRPIDSAENGRMRKYLLGISDEIQTYSNIIKMLTYSIFDSKEMLSKFNDVGDKLDAVHDMCAKMLLQLTEIYTAMTPEGGIKNINIMNEKVKLERGFSEEYKETYLQLFSSLSGLVWHIRQQSIPKDQNKGRKEPNEKK